eukprot:TRINITY_DN61710_c0_g1_i1.p1 TRINITY_DN61710_c0_g1~~TRINITY_DN61710_c0_g1_i1.p1  ORF type:complete len:671 (-),score=124.27 TRINITY_DN61710_c0_g1_i1:90-1958(-)
MAVATYSSFIAILVSLTHIYRHCRYNKSYEIKMSTLRMLVFVPLYACDAVVCLQTEQGANGMPMLLTTFRDVYEAVVLISFVQFLLASMDHFTLIAVSKGTAGGLYARSTSLDDLVGVGLERRTPATRLATILLGHKPRYIGIMTMLSWIRLPVPYRAGPHFVFWVLVGILQYSLAMIVFLVLRVMEWRWLGESTWGVTFDSVAQGLKAASCGFAMFNLILIGTNLKACPELTKAVKDMNLEMKFLSIKLIIFFTFVQKWTIGMCATCGALPHLSGMKSIRHESPAGGSPAGGSRAGPWKELSDMTPKQVADTINNFLLCVELLFMSIWHTSAYKVAEFNQLAARHNLNEATRMKDQDKLVEAIKEAKEANLQKDGFWIDFESGQESFKQALPNTAETELQVVLLDRSFGQEYGMPRKEGVKLLIKDEALDAAERLLQLLNSNDESPAASGWFGRRLSGNLLQAAKRPRRERVYYGCWRCCWYVRLFNDILDLRRTLLAYQDAMDIFTGAGIEKCSEEKLRRAFCATDINQDNVLDLAEVKLLCLAHNQTGLADELYEKARETGNGDITFGVFQTMAENACVKRAAAEAEAVSTRKTAEKEARRKAQARDDSRRTYKPPNVL